MARSSLPGPLERRHLLERELDPAQSLRYAQLYLDHGQTVDAIALLAKASATDRLEALMEEAIEAGDAFLLQLASAALGADPGSERWGRLAAAAEGSGKVRYAEMARRRAERGGD